MRHPVEIRMVVEAVTEDPEEAVDLAKQGILRVLAEHDYDISAFDGDMRTVHVESVVVRSPHNQ